MTCFTRLATWTPGTLKDPTAMTRLCRATVAASCTAIATAIVMLSPATAALPSIELNAKVLVGISGNADKPRIVRTDSGMLVIAYGDSPSEAGLAYDLKDAGLRRARDVFVQTCKPEGMRTCDRQTDWSPAINLSNSALSSSLATRYQGANTERIPYPGDIDKANIRALGSAIAVSWVSKYCPDGDTVTQGIQPTQQRSVVYAEREGRELPFSCVWMAYSLDEGGTWSSPIQRSSGVRDALQDSLVGGFNVSTRRGWIGQVWQEDPQGLLLGEAEGPGDGASGAQVNEGTDIWFGTASFDISGASPAGGSLSLKPAVRLTDNWSGGYGRARSGAMIFDAQGISVPAEQLELGVAGASRPTAATSGSNVLLVYEQTRPRNVTSGLTGKLVRYHAFDYRKPVFDPADPASNRPSGCVISDPNRNARRARIVAQSPEQAGSGQFIAAVFWREGKANQGGPADIVLRRLVGGTDPGRLDPPVDPSCLSGAAGPAGSAAENISSNTWQSSTANLADDTERFAAENAIAHRAVLRGDLLWLGYLYVSDLVQLNARQQGYDFWLRRFSNATGWSMPRNLSRTGDPGVNVREPRLIGTPRSGPGCPSGNVRASSTTDTTDCQNPSTMWAAWGTQSGVIAGSGVSPRDLGILAAASTDAGANFSTARGLSFPPGALFEEEASAFETQVVLRPDGQRFRSVWTQQSNSDGRRDVVVMSGYLPSPAVSLSASTLDDTAAISASPTQPSLPPISSQAPFGTSSSGGCSLSKVALPPDPSLALMATLSCLALMWRRLRRRDQAAPTSG